MTLAGISGGQGSNFLAGVGIMLMAIVPLAQAAGLKERAAYSIGGGALVVWSLLPFRVYQSMVPSMKMDFSVWVFVGLLLVVGSTWLVLYNAPAVLGGVMWLFGRIRVLAPVLKTSIAQSLRDRFRTGTTIALFTLVVFVLVCGVGTSGAFIKALNDEAAFGGGFQVRADTSPASPITEMGLALRQAPGIRNGDITAFAGQSVLPLPVRQGNASTFETDPVRGLDDAFLRTTTFGFAAMARGYQSAGQVWDALATQPNLAVVDAAVAPRRNNWSFGALTKFHLSGFFLEDKVFDPVTVQVQDPQTGAPVTLTIVGVLKDAATTNMFGISTAQRNLAFLGPQARASVWFFTVAKGVDPVAEANALESAFVGNGMQAKAVSRTLQDLVSTSLTFTWLMLGFLGLGLVIGVAALGVISARAVVERRQQIGVLRAIGFQRRMVQLSFLIESSFVTLVGILTGTVLGLIVTYNVISDAARQPTWAGIRFAPPLLAMGAILTVVFLASLATTWLPARRASRIYPALALRYE